MLCAARNVFQFSENVDLERGVLMKIFITVYGYASFCPLICSEHLEKFRWDDLAELKSRAPVLHEFLSMYVDVKRRQRSFKKTHRTTNAAVMGVCASLLLRHKNQHMNALQHIVSLILHRGHAGKQVLFVA